MKFFKNFIFRERVRTLTIAGHGQEKRKESQIPRKYETGRHLPSCGFSN